MKEKCFDLPDEISEIHLGFRTLKHFIDFQDVGKCTELSIIFKNGDWKIRAVHEDKGKVTEVEKIYKKDIVKRMLVENKNPAAK